MKEFEKNGLITKEFVNTFIKKRERDIHKGDCGRILIVAGSKGMAGAAVLCARGALRAGAGLVRVSIPEELFPVIHIGVPEATCITRERLLEPLSQYQAIAIGPGLGDDEENEVLIRHILENYSGTVVLDADGLNLMCGNLAALKAAKAGLIITPHPGEASRLLRRNTAEINMNRLGSAIELSVCTGAVAVLKGSESVVATTEKTTYINTTGNPGMATGGSGDVLTGVIAALAGQGLDRTAAAAVGVYIHGLAGDIKAGQTGEYGLIASDIADAIGIAINTALDREIDLAKIDI